MPEEVNRLDTGNVDADIYATDGSISTQTGAAQAPRYSSAWNSFISSENVTPAENAGDDINLSESWLHPMFYENDFNPEQTVLSPDKAVKSGTTQECLNPLPETVPVEISIQQTVNRPEPVEPWEPASVSLTQTEPYVPVSAPIRTEPFVPVSAPIRTEPFVPVQTVPIQERPQSVPFETMVQKPAGENIQKEPLGAVQAAFGHSAEESYSAPSRQTFYQNDAEAYMRARFPAVPDYSAQAAHSDFTVPAAHMEYAAPTTYMDNTAPTTYMDNTAPTTYMDNTVPATYMDYTVPAAQMDCSALRTQPARYPLSNQYPNINISDSVFYLLLLRLLTLWIRCAY